MERKVLLAAVDKGLNLAKEYEKLKKKLENTFLPAFLGGIVLQVLAIAWTGIFADIFKTKEISVWSELLYFFFFIFMLCLISIPGAILLTHIPVVNKIVGAIGKLLLIIKRRNQKKELKTIETTFEEKTGLHTEFLSVKLLEKFKYYLEIRVAHNLQDCYQLYKQEILYGEVKEIRSQLKNGTS